MDNVRELLYVEKFRTVLQGIKCVLSANRSNREMEKQTFVTKVQFS